MKTVGFIPARFASKRFPGKPLAKIYDKTLIQWTYENASKTLNSLWVLTDEKKIYDHVISFGGQALMTSTECKNGTERIASVLQNKEFNQADVIVNIQGDEPCLPQDTIKGTIQALINHKDTALATAITPIDEKEAHCPHCVKCVTAVNGQALYFSRSPIPYGAKQFLKHLGLYVWKKESLLYFNQLPQAPLQQQEDLEQLKAIENQLIIQTYLTTKATPCVDRPEDVQKVEHYLCQKNTSSLQGASALR